MEKILNTYMKFNYIVASFPSSVNRVNNLKLHVL